MIVHITTGLYLQFLQHVLAVDTDHANHIDTLSLQIVEKARVGVPVIGMHLIPLSWQAYAIVRDVDYLLPALPELPTSDTL